MLIPDCRCVICVLEKCEEALWVSIFVLFRCRLLSILRLSALNRKWSFTHLVKPGSAGKRQVKSVYEKLTYLRWDGSWSSGHCEDEVLCGICGAVSVCKSNKGWRITWKMKRAHTLLYNVNTLQLIYFSTNISTTWFQSDLFNQCIWNSYWNNIDPMFYLNVLIFIYLFCI